MIIPKTNLFRTLEQVGAELMALADDEDGKIRDSDVAKDLGDMRKLHRSSLDSFLAAQAFIETLDTRMKIFAKSIEQFEDLISRRALNYGLSLIPDEVLSEIFSFAAETLEDKVGLSLVCRRFRRVMMSMRKIWSGHYLEIGQTPEQMVAITEGNRFDSLKAVIHGRSEVERSSAYVAWVRKRALHPMELIDQFYERSLDFILPLRLEELQIQGLGGKEKDSQRILDSVAMQSVRTLQIQDCYNPVWRTLERRHTPSLQDLVVDFVPGSAVGRDLIRCKLSDINNRKLDSLREFLASANALQYLLLFIRNGHFYEARDLPSLRSLAVNFIPHPSFARHLSRFTLSWPHPNILARLLDFLSSAEMLQALSIYLNGGFDRDALGAFPANSRVVTLPHLASCEIHQGGFRFVEPILVHPLSARLRMPVLRRLELQFRSDFVGFDEVLKVLDDHPQDNFIVPLGRLIYFEGCRELTPNLVNTVAGILTDIDPVQIKFDDCRGWKDGTFRPDETGSAWLDEDKSESK